MAISIIYEIITGYEWDYTFYKWGDLLVLITGISGHNCKLSRTIFRATYATADLLPASQSPTDAISMRSRLHATKQTTVEWPNMAKFHMFLQASRKINLSLESSKI